MIKIQVQDGIFSWMTVEQLQEGDANNIAFYMQNVKSNYPDQRVRAVSASGSLLDMM